MRNYPSNVRRTAEAAELRLHRVISLVAGGASFRQIVARLHRNANYTYRLLERAGIKSVLLTPNEQATLARDRKRRKR